MARRITNLIPVLLLASCFSGIAQTTSEPIRNISFWVYRVGMGNWADIKFESGNNEVDTLSPGKYMKGRVHEYQGPSHLVFFREKPDPTPDDPVRISRIPVAQVQIPNGIRETIFILTPFPEGSKFEFAVYLIDADPADFPVNSIRVFNATGVRLAGKVGRDQMYFEPGVSEAFSLTPFLDEGIPVTFLVETRDGPKFVFEKALEFAANRRVILLLEPPRRKGSYRIQATNLIEVIE